MVTLLKHLRHGSMLGDVKNICQNKKADYGKKQFLNLPKGKNDFKAILFKVFKIFLHLALSALTLDK